MLTAGAFTPAISCHEQNVVGKHQVPSCPASEKHLGCEASLMLLLDICWYLGIVSKMSFPVIYWQGYDMFANDCSYYDTRDAKWVQPRNNVEANRGNPVIKRGNGNPLCMIWLVVYRPLWKIWKSVGMMKFPKYGKIENVWNHQPDDYKWSLEWENPLTNGHFICFLHHLDVPKAAKRASGLPASASDSSAWPAVHLPVYM